MIWDDLISRVLAREGGWSDRAIDKGGPTNRGVTLKTFAGWRRRDLPLEKLTAAEVRELTDDLRMLSEAEARNIYLQRYVKDIGLDMLGSEQLQEVMFDWAVNSGPSHPVKALQRELGVVVDGVLGQETARAAITKNGVRLAQRILWDRAVFIAQWMRTDKRDADRDGVPDSMENAAGIIIRIANLGRSLA